MDEFLIKNCKSKYDCDQDWSKIKKTDNSYVRLCGFCKKDVHLVSTDSELDKAIKNNWCVAVADNSEIDFELTIGDITPVDINLLK